MAGPVGGQGLAAAAASTGGARNVVVVAPIVPELARRPAPGAALGVQLLAARALRPQPADKQSTGRLVPGRDGEVPGWEGDGGALSPRLLGLGSPVPGGRWACGQSPAQVHSGEFLHTRSLSFSICQMETIAPTRGSS